MAHNVNTYVGKAKPWWDLMEAGYKATVTGKLVSWQDVLEHGGFDFDVFKSQLFDGLGRPVDSWGVFRWNLEDKAKDDQAAAIFLSAVGKDYTVIHHSKGFEMVDALVQSKDGAHYETAGVLGRGERVWGLADLNQSMHIGGDDKVDVYLLFSTSHDGSLSYNFRIVTIRVVCENTLGMALGANTRASFTVRHTANADQRITDAHKVLANLGTDITRMEDKLNFLAQRKMTREAMTTIMDRLFPKTEKEKDGEIVLESSTRRENLISEVLKTYELNDGNAFPEQRGTAWNLLNAVTAWTDHQRSAKDDGKRAEAAMFGSGDILKSRAFEVIMEQSQKLAPTATAVKRSYSSGSGSTGSSLLDSVADSTVGSRN